MVTKVGYITRIVKVDRKRSPQEALRATSRASYVTDSVVATMPNSSTDEEVEVIFFKLGREISNDNLLKQYDLRGLDPVDPHTLAAVNEADPAFADKCPNGTEWKDVNDEWCFALFGYWNSNERSVYISRSDNGEDWDNIWWFAGVRKSIEKIVSELIISFKEQVQKSTTPVIFIPDTIGGGPTDTTSVQKVSDIAEAFLAKLSEENIHVSMERDPADFREYYIDTL